jgi:lysophospholipase L1-like esterase
MEGRLVFSFGINDISRPLGRETRVSHSDSVACATTMMREAKEWLPTIWIGPTPANESMSPMSPAPGIWFEFSNERLLALNSAFKRVASELGIPFLDLATPLSTNASYQRSLVEGDRMHCSGEGYELIAEAVDAWPAWRDLSSTPISQAIQSPPTVPRA